MEYCEFEEEKKTHTHKKKRTNYKKIADKSEVQGYRDFLKG